MALAASVLAFTPLFNLLGYEFALAVGVVVALVIGPVTMLDLREGSSPSPTRGQGSELLSPAHTFGVLSADNLSLLLLPLLLITLNALRVTVCDYRSGLILYAILPGVTALYSTLSAMASASLTGGRRVLRVLVYYGLMLLSIGGGAAYLALEPPIVAMNPYIGYFAGSIYDEALAVPLPLLVYRSLQLALIAALVSAMEIAHRWGRQKIGVGLGLLFLLSSLVVAVGHSQHSAIGYSLTRADIQAELGGRYETEHFIIYFSTDGDWNQRIERIAEDHEFRYSQLKRFFGEEPPGKLVSYIYPNRDEKGRLMGARRTLVAKLWSGEMHILYPHYGVSVLKHELAHLFTAPFGTGPLKLSTKAGLFPNMGLVEGIAAAAQWEAKEFTPHGWAAALRKIEKAPDIEGILSAAGFWAQHSRTVYTVMGSFSRWLIETRGIERFKKAYAHGDFEGAYETPLSTLIKGWHAHLDTITLGEADLELARFYFDRPSIFGKVCARALAEQRRRVDQLTRSGLHLDAVHAMNEICEQDPNNIGYKHDMVKLHLKAKAPDKARTLALSLLDLKGIGGVRRAKLQGDLGDLAWRRGDLEEARRYYLLIAKTLGLSHNQRRTAQVKLIATSDAALRAPIQRYFFAEGTSTAQRIAELYRIRREQPSAGLPAYLIGLLLRNEQAYDEAITQLEVALELGFGHGSETGEIEQKARIMLAESLFFADRLDEAAAAFDALTKEAYREGERAWAADWLERVRWRQRRDLEVSQ